MEELFVTSRPVFASRESNSDMVTIKLESGETRTVKTVNKFDNKFYVLEMLEGTFPAFFGESLFILTQSDPSNSKEWETSLKFIWQTSLLEVSSLFPIIG